jgi:hypothetical protein
MWIFKYILINKNSQWYNKMFINNNMLNIQELIRRIIKYLIEGFMVAIAAYAIPARSLNIEEILALTLTATATFAILDTYIPSIGAKTREGAGLGIGLNMVGF